MTEYLRPSTGQWVLGTIQIGIRDESHKWLIARVSEVIVDGKFETNRFCHARARSFDADWPTVRTVKFRDVRRIFRDEAEMLSVHDYLTKAYELLYAYGDTIMMPSYEAVVVMAKAGEDDRAINILGEQLALAGQIREHVRLFQAKMKLLID